MSASEGGRACRGKGGGAERCDHFDLVGKGPGGGWASGAGRELAGIGTEFGGMGVRFVRAGAHNPQPRGADLWQEGGVLASEVEGVVCI